jgi:predicted lipoprotein with Yx(FWY)xxD motif
MTCCGKCGKLCALVAGIGEDAFMIVFAVKVILKVALIAPFLSWPAQAVEAAPAEIKLNKSDAGWTLTDARGMTVYVYERDKAKPGESTCNAPEAKDAAKGGGCAHEWPAVRAAANAKPFDEWDIITRQDGSKQWAFQGRPLYTHAKDTYAGATFGEGDLWHVAFRPVDTPPEIKISAAVVGRILTDLRGMTLYTRDGESVEKDAACVGRCLETWAPLVAPWVAGPHGNWSVVVREGGMRQWAFRGRPLYTFVGDLEAGHTNGHGTDYVWHAAILQAAPALPSWIKVEISDMGRVLADANGRTLYGFVGDIEKVKRIACTDDCIRTYWRPIHAAADAKPVANFSAATTADGTKQWAYKGALLYTYVLDEKPGHIRGDRFASASGNKMAAGGWWRPILESCMCVAPIHVP